MRNRSFVHPLPASPQPFRNSGASTLTGSKVPDATLEQNSCYNGLGTEAFNLLAHLVMVILKALGLFTNGQVN